MRVNQGSHVQINVRMRVRTIPIPKRFNINRTFPLTFHFIYLILKTSRISKQNFLDTDSKVKRIYRGDKMHVNIHRSAENCLAQWVERAVAGEEVIFERNGEPVAKLVSLKPENHKEPRRGGQWKGKVKIVPDFDELPDSFMAAFRMEKD